MTMDNGQCREASADYQSSIDHSPLDEVPAGYKRTEVGVIPEDWVVARIDEYYDVISSKRVLQRDWKSRGVPFYRAREVAVLAEKGVVDNELFITEDLYLTLKSKYGVPKVGDALVTGIGTIGKVYTVSPDNMFYFKDASVLWLKSRGGYSSEFLKQVFLTDIIVKQIKNSSMGTTVETYTIQSAKKTLVPTPSLEEQRAIATALSDVDALITALDKLIAKKRAIKTAAMQQLLTGKTRLPGFSGEWETKRLGDLFEVSAGQDLTKSEYSSEQDEKHRYPIFANSVSNEGLYGFSSFYEYEGNSITVTARGTLGVSFFRDKKFVAIGRLLVLQPKGRVNCNFVSEAINHNIKFANESTGVPQLTSPQIAKYEILIPCCEEQTAIAQILSDMDAEITALEARRDKTRAIKQGMMQQLLTGRVRLVKPAGREAA